MRIRPALAAAALTAALAVGVAGAPAQAADADKGIRTTSVLAPTGATASWHTLDEFFWGLECEAAKTSLEIQTGWILRCTGGSAVTYYKLQRWY
ncbi:MULTISPECIES: hypothetical protein [unclassified Streptomyces]|uniref:hypothetical protein n=1 Tax=unclassified Streptomyces TaxID=2593676 RepID=UPI0013BE9F76|nr:hypothetical protein [Streptomyces sp. CB09001]